MVPVVGDLRPLEQLVFIWAVLAEILPKLHTEFQRQDSKPSPRQQSSSPPSVMTHWVVSFWTRCEGLACEQTVL
jgi:hypothetical protein